MRLLFLVAGEPNQGDIYYQGLKAVLGDDCVEFPHKPSYHLTLEEGRLVSRDGSGEPLVEESAVGYLVDRRHGWSIPKYFGIVDQRGCRYQDGHEPDPTEFDAVLVSFIRPSNHSFVRKLLTDARYEHVPVFFIDGEDDPFIRTVYFRRQVRRYFKREVIRSPFVDRHYLRRSVGLYAYSLARTGYSKLNSCVMAALGSLPKVEPLSLTVPEDRPGEVEKRYDLSLVVALTSPFRARLYEHVLRYVRRRGLNAFVRMLPSKGSPIPFDDYRRIMTQSKLAISAQGAGFDTFRYWEIPNYGAGLVSQRPYIDIRDDFSDGRNAIFYGDMKEFETKLDHYLAAERWEEVARSGRSHFLAHHTPAHRAAQMVASIRSRLESQRGRSGI